MQKIIIPTCCPCCNYLLETVNDQLFCRNTSCSAQLNKRVEHLAKTLQIKGLGPATIKKLNIQDILEIFYLDKKEVCTILGEKVATKLLDEIDRAKDASLAAVLASMSIPLIGSTASEKIAGTVKTIDEINSETCAEAGLGAKVTHNLLTWLSTEYLELKEFLPFTFKNGTIKPSNIDAKRVCITGKLKAYNKKSDAEGALLAAGFILVDSVTKNTDYLIDEEGKGSSKRDKAVNYGITIISNLNDFLRDK